MFVVDSMASSDAEIEWHPLKPFLPENAKVIFLGSFPPPRKRWSMDFFYPNWINDHWRIEGQVFFGDKNRFVDNELKTFRLEDVVSFLCDRGIALFDTATAVDERKHVGLRNIRERLKVMVNGTLDIDSTPGVGTKVTIKIPKEVNK